MHSHLRTRPRPGRISIVFAPTGIVIALVVSTLLIMLPQHARARPQHARVTASPNCSRQAARAATPRTPLGRRFLRFISGTPWGIATLICKPLRDGDRTDMVAVADCCTAASPTPLFIFKPGRGSWHLSYATDLNTLLDGLRAQGRTLIETRPVYGPSDPLCCPSSHSHWSVRWNGHRWVVKRIGNRPAGEVG